MNTNSLRILFSASMLFSLGHAQIGHAETHTAVGDVYNVKNDQLIYHEFHTFDHTMNNGSMRTEYKNPGGALIAERTVNFINGYASDYLFKQADLGIEKHVTRGTSTINYVGKIDNKRRRKQFSPSNISTAIVNAGMFNAIQRNWPKLIAGEATSIDLIIPDRAQSVRMILEKNKLNSSSMGAHLSTEQRVVFTLKPDSRLLRLLVAPIELGYDLVSKRLVYYRGPSNIRDAHNKAYKSIRVIYKNRSY